VKKIDRHIKSTKNQRQRQINFKPLLKRFREEFIFEVILSVKIEINAPAIDYGRFYGVFSKNLSGLSVWVKIFPSKS